MRLINYFLVMIVAMQILSATAQTLTTNAQAEPLRPAFHFTPQERWMNDPNGLLYANGEYHLFYQYNPYATVWGPMHWGHAVSKDLAHWEQLPIALYPDEHGTIFSGSAVLDKDNTSGFGVNGVAPMVAIFTYNYQYQERVTGFQTQGIAYSLDSGRSWQKYAQNPVLPNTELKDFRDPKVFWFEPKKKWIMSLVAGDRVKFYSSPNLKNWQHESDFGMALGSHGGVWECPDLIPITLAGTHIKKYLLLVSITPGSINGGSGTQYFVGDFDGSVFTLDKKFSAQLQQKAKLKQDPAEWLDYGSDNYAGVTFNNLPDANRTLFLGWMNNWNYANNIVVGKWNGAMTLPRDLSLVLRGDQYLLKSTPVAELAQLVKARKSIAAMSFSNQVTLVDGAQGEALPQHVQLILNVKRAGKLSLTLGNASESVLINFDMASKQLVFDRSRSGNTAFSDKFVRNNIAPLTIKDGKLTVDLYIDRSSIELFINGGELSLTNQVFPRQPYQRLTLAAEGEVAIERGELAYFH